MWCGRGVLGNYLHIFTLPWLYFTCLLLRDQIPSTVLTDHHNISPSWLLLLADRAAGRVQLTAAEFQIIQREPSRSNQRSQNTQTGD